MNIGDNKVADYKLLISYQFNTLTESGFGNLIIKSCKQILSERDLDYIKVEIISENKQKGILVTNVIILNILELSS